MTVVLNTGVPRSGTVLVNAIIRRCLARLGVDPIQTNPHAGALPQALRDALDTPDRTTLVHTHSWDADSAQLVSARDKVVCFANRRDPRDVCVSLMRLHDHDFATAAQMTLAAFSLFEATCRSTGAIVIPYERLMAAKRESIAQIAQRLGLAGEESDIAEIDAETSIGRHRETMLAVRAGTLGNLRRIRNRHRVLVEDADSLINDRHIQSGECGRWRKELSADQRTRANAVFSELVARHDYPLD